MVDRPLAGRGFNPEVVLLLLLLVFFGIFGFLAFDFQPRARWMPMGSAMAGLLLVIARLMSRNRKDDASEEKPAQKGWLPIGATLGAALTAASLGGFIFCVPLCYVLFDFLNAGRLTLRSLLLATVMTIFVYFFFGRFLNIPLTNGIL